jgi:MFS family permease
MSLSFQLRHVPITPANVAADTTPPTTEEPADEVINFTENDSANPRNWPKWRRYNIVILTSFVLMLSSMASSMVAPALEVMAEDLKISSTVQTQLILSIFVLSYGLIPLICAPLSEIYGRVPLLQIGNAFFIVTNAACGLSKTGTQMFVFRLLSGCGAGAPLAVRPSTLARSTIADIWTGRDRYRT